MEIPVENVLAAYPPARRAGRLVLQPLTLGGALALAALGVDFSKSRVETAKLPVVAAVLAGLISPNAALHGEPRALARAIRLVKPHLSAVSEAVEKVFNDAFATRIKAAVPENAPISFTPHGLGWPLRLAEELCAEYGWSFDAALATPLSRAWALEACARERHGGRHGDFDYVERIEAEKIRARHAPHAPQAPTPTPPAPLTPTPTP